MTSLRSSPNPPLVSCSPRRCLRPFRCLRPSNGPRPCVLAHGHCTISQLGLLRFDLNIKRIYEGFATNTMVAMVRHGRAPEGGAAKGSMSASMNLATSSLKSADVDAGMHVHAPMQPAGFPTYPDGEATPIWAFPWPATRCDLGRPHWSTVQMSKMRAGSWYCRRFSTPQHEMR